MVFLFNNVNRCLTNNASWFDVTHRPLNFFPSSRDEISTSFALRTRGVPAKVKLIFYYAHVNEKLVGRRQYSPIDFLLVWIYIICQWHFNDKKVYVQFFTSDQIYYPRLLEHWLRRIIYRTTFHFILLKDERKTFTFLFQYFRLWLPICCNMETITS